MLRKGLYLVFASAVILGYATMVRRAYDPAAVRSDERVMPSGPRQASTRRPYRQPSFIWLGGFGGK